MKRKHLAFAVVSLLVLAPNTFADSSDSNSDNTNFPTNISVPSSQNPFAETALKLKEEEIFNRKIPTFNMDPSRVHFNASKYFQPSASQPQQDPAPTDDVDAAPAGVAPVAAAQVVPVVAPVAAPAPVAVTVKPVAADPTIAAQAVQGSVDSVAEGLAANAPSAAAAPAIKYSAFQTPNINPVAAQPSAQYMSPSLASAPADPQASGSAPVERPVAQAQQPLQAQQVLAPQAAPEAQQISSDPQQAASQTVDAMSSLNNQHQDVEGSVACTDDPNMKDAYHRYDEKASGKLRKKGDEREAKMNAAFADILNRAIKDGSDVAKMKFWQKVENKDYTLPAKGALKSSCILVIPGEKSIAFGSLGFTYGAGAYKCKDASSASGWGPTHFVQSEGISKGFQIGAKDTDRVLFFDSPDAIKQLGGSTINACAGAAVAVGPYGRDAQACTDASLKPIYSYSSTKGVFAGISLQGVRIHQDKNMDAIENNQLVSQQKRHWYTLGLRGGHRNICAMASDQQEGNPGQVVGGAEAASPQTSQAGKM
jgi:lipid-binding SYLF domain-containing protein